MRLALETQKNNPRQDLGKILLSLGFISGADLAQAQAQRLGLDYVELTRDFDRDVVALVPEYCASTAPSRSGYPVPGTSWLR